MKKICLQAGHINAQYHTITSLKGNTGAPGEQELTQRITDRVAFMLRERGFDVKQTDAVAYNDTTVTKVDWDLFLAIHGDADVYKKGGGFIDRPAPATDGAATESGRIMDVIESVYFKESHIENYSERRNANTAYYYMWKYLTGPTPCNIIELGVVQDAHDKVLLSDTNLISSALVRGICKAFNVSYDINPTPQPPATDPKDQKIQELERDVAVAKNALDTEKTQNAAKLAEFKTECQVKLNELQELIINL
jgi:hypothetical protein